MIAPAGVKLYNCPAPEEIVSAREPTRTIVCIRHGTNDNSTAQLSEFKRDIFNYYICIKQTLQVYDRLYDMHVCASHAVSGANTLRAKLDKFAKHEG